MGKLYAIVGRPGTGKSAYLNKMKAASGKRGFRLPEQSSSETASRQ